MPSCPRTIFLKNGKQRTVRCRSWTCEPCAAIKRRFITRAVRETFVPALSLAVRIRAREEGHADSLTRVWARLRSRLPGIRYLAVQEPDPDGHLHAIITYIDALSIREHALAAGAHDVDIEPVRDIGDFISYLLDKRQDCRAPRVMHSRDLTKLIHERTHHATETQEAQEATAARAEETGAAQSQETGAGQAQEAAPIAAQIPAQRPPSSAPSLAVDDDDQRAALHTLIEAAVLAGAQITITINWNQNPCQPDPASYSPMPCNASSPNCGASPTVAAARLPPTAMT